MIQDPTTENTVVDVPTASEMIDRISDAVPSFKEMLDTESYRYEYETSQHISDHGILGQGKERLISELAELGIEIIGDKIILTNNYFGLDALVVLRKKLDRYHIVPYLAKLDEDALAAWTRLVLSEEKPENEGIVRFIKAFAMEAIGGSERLNRALRWLTPDRIASEPAFFDYLEWCVEEADRIQDDDLYAEEEDIAKAVVDCTRMLDRFELACDTLDMADRQKNTEIKFDIAVDNFSRACNENIRDGKIYKLQDGSHTKHLYHPEKFDPYTDDQIDLQVAYFYSFTSKNRLTDIIEKTANERNWSTIVINEMKKAAKFLPLSDDLLLPITVK